MILDLNGGNIVECEPSRFLDEINIEFLEKNNFKEDFKPTIQNNISRIRKLRKKGFINVNKINTINTSVINIVTNDVVEHQRFGIGTVEKVEGDEQNKKATINFKIEMYLYFLLDKYSFLFLTVKVTKRSLLIKTLLRSNN